MGDECAGRGKTKIQLSMNGCQHQTIAVCKNTISHIVCENQLNLTIGFSSC